MKGKYISPECEIIKFDAEDVLATSGVKGLIYTEEEDDFAEFGADKFK